MAALLASALLAVRAQGWTVHKVNPADTDAAITNFLAEHHAYIDTNAPPRNKLFLFIPGTTAIPAYYTNITITAAELGFHALGIAYVNDKGVNATCWRTTDPTLYEKVRLEIIDGTDRTDLVDVDRTNSMEHRLIKCLEYLDANWPQEQWGQYLGAETNLLWDKMLVAGHSQGGGHAGILAKKHEVVRCIMFDATDWWGHGKRAADWILAPSATPTNRYYAFAHVLDPIGSNTFRATWTAYGLDRFGASRFFEDEAGPPYSWTHEMWTDTEPAIGGDDSAYHNSPVVDFELPMEADGVTPIYKPVWQWMMAGPTRQPNLRIAVTGSNQVALPYVSCVDVDYQLEASGDLVAGTWIPLAGPVPGNDGISAFIVDTDTPARFYRLRLSY
jgi:hypothetical protein